MPTPFDSSGIFPRLAPTTEYFVSTEKMYSGFGRLSVFKRSEELGEIIKIERRKNNEQRENQSHD